MVNKAEIIGRLGKDPEIRFATTGTAFANFTVATDRKWKDKSGEMQKETEWHKVTAFGRTAEVCGEYLKKGSLVYVAGRLQTRKWKNKEGQDCYTTEIVCEDMKMLDGKQDKPQGDTRQTKHTEPESDDVPF
jgi:single-strand DNA-binding protein